MSAAPVVAASNSIGVPIELVAKATEKGIDLFQYLAQSGTSIAPHELRAAMEALESARAQGGNPVNAAPPAASPTVAATESKAESPMEATPASNASSNTAPTNGSGDIESQIADAAQRDPFVRMLKSRGEPSKQDKEMMLSMYEKVLEERNQLAQKTAEIEKQEKLTQRAATELMVEILGMLNGTDALPTAAEKQAFSQSLNEKGVPNLSMVYPSLVEAKKRLCAQHGVAYTPHVANNTPPQVTQSTMPNIVAASASTAAKTTDDGLNERLKRYLRTLSSSASNVSVGSSVPLQPSTPVAPLPLVPQTTLDQQQMFRPSYYQLPLVSAKRTREQAPIDPIAAGLGHSETILSHIPGLEQSLKAASDANNDLLFAANKKAKASETPAKWTPKLQPDD